MVAGGSFSQSETFDSRLVYRLLKIRLAYCERRAEAKLTPLDMGLIDIVHLGELEGRPYDASSISASIGLSRSTASRHLRKLEKRGLIEQRPAGRNRHYYCTDEARERLMSLLEPIARMCGFTED